MPPKWYTYLNLKEVKEADRGTKNFYAVVEEIEERTSACVFLRLWDQSRTRVVIKLMGSFVKIIEKGDILRVHRLQRLDQRDAYDTIGFGEPGKMTQVIVWRVNDSGDGYAMVGSSSKDKYTRNDNDIQLVQALHICWKALERVVSPLDSFYDTTSSQMTQADGNTSRVIPDAEIAESSQLIIDECSLQEIDSRMAEDRLDALMDDSEDMDVSFNVDSQLAGHRLDSLLDDVTLVEDIEESVIVDPITAQNNLDSLWDDTTIVGEIEDSVYVDAITAQNNLDSLLDDSTHDEEIVEIEESVIVDSTVADHNLNFLLDDTTLSDEIEEIEMIEATRPPLPPLSTELERRLLKAVHISDIREYKHYDCLLQVVDAHVDLTPTVHVVMRCFDPQSSIPKCAMPLRMHPRTSVKDELMAILPDESIVEASRGKTVDIFCYAYDEHVGDEGRDIVSGDWLLFCDLNVEVPCNSNETMLMMNRGGEQFGRCIKLVKYGSHNTETDKSVLKEITNEDKITEEDSIKEPVEKEVVSIVKENHARFEVNEDNENNSTSLPLHSFRTIFDENDTMDMFPRCKTIQPFVKWWKQIVPSDVVVEEPAIDSMQLISRVYCNCGVPLNQEDNDCLRQNNDTKIHEYFYRTNIISPYMESSLISRSDDIVTNVKNQILPSISCISHNSVPTTFDLIVQISHLTAKTGKCTTRFPLCHISVWDGTIPPKSIERSQLLRDLTTSVDKTIVGSVSQLELISQRTIDVRMANMTKVRAGEFAILRDVFIVRAYSVEGDDRSLSPAWMLQARNIDVIREAPKSAEELAAFMEVARRISSVILSENESDKNTKQMTNNEDTVVKRKNIDVNPKRSKRIRLDQGTDDNWLDELADKEKEDILSQEPLIYNLQCTITSIDVPRLSHCDFANNCGKFASYHTFTHDSREMWQGWLTICNSFNTLKGRLEQNGCCPEECGEKEHMYAHIPFEYPNDKSKCLHLLIDVSHFRDGNIRIPFDKWNELTQKAKLDDMKEIKKAIHESSIAVHRVRMVHLKSVLVFVVSDDDGWITVTKRRSRNNALSYDLVL